MVVRGRFIHVVLFWFREGVSENEKGGMVKACREHLSSIPSVRFLSVGEPGGVEREVVDNSFDLGLVVHFDDRAGHDTYQESDAHNEFIESFGTLWSKVRVYDLDC